MYFLAKDCPAGLENLIYFINNLLNLIRTIIPILLIVIGSIDLGKAVVAGEDKEIKAAQGMLVKRTIAAVAVFFVGTLVTVVMRLVNPTWEACVSFEKSIDTNASAIVVIENQLL